MRSYFYCTFSHTALLLQDLLHGLSTVSVHGSTETTIANISFDSREAGPGSLFVAVKGTQADGHQFIRKTVEQGAVAVVCETLPDALPAGVTFIRVANTAKALGNIASQFYGNPSAKLKLVASRLPPQPTMVIIRASPSRRE